VLIIRDDQLEIFRKEKRQNFYDHIESVLRNKIPKLHDQPSDQIQSLIVKSRDLASRYGFFQPEDLECFMIYCGQYGGAFGETPQTSWANPILENWSITPKEKIDQLDALGHLAKDINS
jgi:hypothetical protein